MRVCTSHFASRNGVRCGDLSCHECRRHVRYRHVKVGDQPGQCRGRRPDHFQPAGALQDRAHRRTAVHHGCIHDDRRQLATRLLRHADRSSLRDRHSSRERWADGVGSGECCPGPDDHEVSNRCRSGRGHHRGRLSYHVQHDAWHQYLGVGEQHHRGDAPDEPERNFGQSAVRHPDLVSRFHEQQGSRQLHRHGCVRDGCGRQRDRRLYRRECFAQLCRGDRRGFKKPDFRKQLRNLHRGHRHDGERDPGQLHRYGRLGHGEGSQHAGRHPDLIPVQHGGRHKRRGRQPDFGEWGEWSEYLRNKRIPQQRAGQRYWRGLHRHRGSGQHGKRRGDCQRAQQYNRRYCVGRRQSDRRQRNRDTCLWFVRRAQRDSGQRDRRGRLWHGGSVEQAMGYRPEFLAEHAGRGDERGVEECHFRKRRLCDRHGSGGRWPHHRGQLHRHGRDGIVRHYQR